MADDGGSTGMLRQDLGMAAPGDIRSCLQSLANCEPLMAQLMAYRFADGTLADYIPAKRIALPEN